MDWFQRWPKEALIAVADHFLSQYDIVCSEEVKKQVIQTMGIVHDGVAECCVEYFQRYLRTYVSTQMRRIVGYILNAKLPCVLRGCVNSCVSGIAIKRARLQASANDPRHSQVVLVLPCWLQDHIWAEEV